MLNRLYLLIENKSLLYGVPFLLVGLFSLLSLNPILSWYLFYNAIALLFVENIQNFSRFLRKQFRTEQPIFLMIWKYLLIVFLSIGLILILFGLPVYSFTPNIYWNLGLYMLIYLVWGTRIESMYHGHSELTILKSQTVCTKPNFHLTWSNFRLPMTSMVITSLLIAFYLIVTDHISSVFDYEAILLFITIVVFSAHLMINALILGEFYWELNPEHKGLTTYNEKYLLIMHYKGRIPNIDNYMELTIFMKKISKFTTPHPQFFSFIRNNLVELVDRVKDVSYHGFVFHLINAMENWGKLGKEIFPEYNIIVLSNFSRYRNFGLIELHRRKLFYLYLLSMFKASMIPIKIVELLEYEIASKNIQARYEMGVALKLPYNQSLYNGEVNMRSNRTGLRIASFRTWTSIWEGRIYIGQQGYNRMTEDLPKVFLSIDKLGEWEKEVWKVTIEYIKMFIGDSESPIFTVSSNPQEKLEHLSKKQSLKTFKNFREILADERSKEKADFDIRKGNQSISRKHRDLSQEEIDQIIKMQFGQLKERKYSVFYNIKMGLAKFDTIKIIKLLMVLLVNLSLLVIITLFYFDAGLWIMSVEVLLILFVAMDGYDEADTRLSLVKQPNRYDQIKIEYTSRTTWIIYGLLLISSYLSVRSFF
jgi:hypothetical protein